MLPDHFQPFEFNSKLKSWYLEHHRPLLWRETTDPYKIWLSEIILQQTRVAQGTPYYIKFVENFPTVFDLAAAEERDVLRLWQGLGYYSRARNMHFTARQVVSQYGGNFPETAAELSKLKGLGSYTAAAIASFAFQEAVPAIDGNVYRVLSRLFGVFTDILSNEGKKQFTAIALQLISQEDPATFNQAMIEFGAIQCVPVSPDCSVCPFANLCFAFQFDAQNKLPVKMKKAAVRNRYLNYIILRQGNRIAMHERTDKGIWKGLYDFYLIESERDNASPEDMMSIGFFQDWASKSALREVPKNYVHLLTHQRLNVHFWWMELSDASTITLPEGLIFYDQDEIEALPKPILIDQVLRDENYLQSDTSI
jgi:A/G-specific adenine glycosylase